MRLWPFGKTRLDLEKVRAEARREFAQELLRAAGGNPDAHQPQGSGTNWMLAQGLSAPYMDPNRRRPVFAFDTPIRFATPIPPNRRPAPGLLPAITIETLRQLADTYDILRSCITHLKREVAAVPLQIVARDEGRAETLADEIQQVTQFFEVEGGLGGRGRRRTHFESILIEDLLVIGAGAVWLHPTRGGGVHEAIPIDASTIRPKVDAFGWPGPDDLVYQQWIYGTPVVEFTRKQLIYDGIWPRSYTPYFSSAVEWLIMTILSALKADEWNRLWLTDGTMPSDAIPVPPEWTPEQLFQYAEWFTALMSGNTRERQQLRFIPGGMGRPNPTRKDQDFEAFQLWLMKRTCSCMGVAPASIGYADGQYKVSQEDSMDATTVFGAAVLLDFRKALYDDLLQRMGYPELEAQNVTAQEEQAAARADRNTKLVAGGIKSINESRSEEGLKPVEGGDTLFVPTTVQPLAMALKPPEPATPPNGGSSSPNGRSSPDTAGGSQQRAAESRPSVTVEAARAIGERLGVEWKQVAFTPEALAQGMTVEFEHSDLTGGDLEETARIALAHLRERPDYYDKLRGMEARAAGIRPPGKLYLIAHAGTRYNAPPDTIAGWSDVSLLPKGREEAAKLADALCGAGITRVVASELKRAHETAQILAERLNLPAPEPRFNLRPWKLGVFEGQLSAEAEPKLRPYVEDPLTLPEGGEMFATFRNRFDQGLRDLLGAALAGETIAAVTHSRNLDLARAFVACGGKMDSRLYGREVMRDGVKPANQMVLTFDGERWRIEEEDRPAERAAASEGGRTPLIQWERKALKRLKDGKSAACSFTSDEIGAELGAEIGAALAQCDTPELVRAVFAAARAPGAQIAQAMRRQIAAKWRERRLAAERQALDE